MNNLNISAKLASEITFNSMDSAYKLAEKFHLKDDDQRNCQSYFIGFYSQNLVTASILLAAQTEYPDLLCAMAFIQLPDLKDRIAFADSEGKLSTFGTQVTESLRQFTIFPNDSKLRQLIFVESISVFDKYLRELTSDPAICEDLKARVLYLKQLFPAPVRSMSNAG